MGILVFLNLGSVFQPIFIPSSSEIDHRPQPFASHSDIRGSPLQKGKTHKVVMQPHCKAISFSSRGLEWINLAGRGVQKKKNCRDSERRLNLIYLDTSWRANDETVLCDELGMRVSYIYIFWFVNENKVNKVFGIVPVDCLSRLSAMVQMVQYILMGYLQTLNCHLLQFLHLYLVKRLW